MYRLGRHDDKIDACCIPEGILPGRKAKIDRVNNTHEKTPVISWTSSYKRRDGHAGGKQERFLGVTRAPATGMSSEVFIG
jgi:hypothetical protein